MSSTLARPSGLQHLGILCTTTQIKLQKEALSLSNVADPRQIWCHIQAQAELEPQLEDQQ
jgi:hypothetical protein